jgi:hypothetical protein
VVGELRLEMIAPVVLAANDNGIYGSPYVPGLTRVTRLGQSDGLNLSLITFALTYSPNNKSSICFKREFIPNISMYIY